MRPRRELLKEGVSNLRNEGVFTFFRNAIGHILPEPYGRYFNTRAKLFGDLVSNGPSSNLSARESFRACRLGFTQELYMYYGLAGDGDPGDYLNEVDRIQAKRINKNPILLDNKARFYEYLIEEGFGKYIPELYGHIGNAGLENSEYESIGTLLDRQNKIIIKDTGGGGGENTYIITKDNGEISLSGKGGRTTVSEEQITQYKGYLVTEFCEQADYIHNICPKTTNTLRILTFRDHEGEVFVPAVVHRIGSYKTAPLDNFSQGGLSAWVDRSSGTLGKAAERVPGKKLKWHSVHPDTDVRIEGETIPEWRKLLLDIKTIAGELTAITYAGWDVVVTGPGTFKIIEANSHPNPDVTQIHRPLLEEESARNFFGYHGLGDDGS